MKRFIVNGGRRLVGEVMVSGSKNAALPILFSTLAVKGVSKIKNVPDIGDVRITVGILRSMGARITRRGSVLTVDTTSVLYNTPSERDTAQIRASTYLIGSCLSRFGGCELLRFGGCNFAKRPIDLHLFAAECLGAEIQERVVKCKRLTGAEIRFSKKSVGATVNALIMASGANGMSKIYNYAEEPHILDLIKYLRNAGATIELYPEYILVEGRELHGAEITVGADLIEAGSYAAFALATGGDVILKGIKDTEMSTVIAAVTSAGGSASSVDGGVRFFGQVSKAFEIIAAPYPGFPTDLQPIFSTLMAFGSGGGYTDTVFPERFSHLSELSAFGVCYYKVMDRIIVPEIKHATAATVSAQDLRGGAACLLAALGTEGESSIPFAERIMRGYERPQEKLVGLGASVSLIG